MSQEYTCNYWKKEQPDRSCTKGAKSCNQYHAQKIGYERYAGCTKHKGKIPFKKQKQNEYINKSVKNSYGP